MQLLFPWVNQERYGKGESGAKSSNALFDIRLLVPDLLLIQKI
jgi:hypothetical protein